MERIYINVFPYNFKTNVSETAHKSDNRWLKVSLMENVINLSITLKG
jgi:hypothetical protein